jgi:hypothetical protein
MGTFNSTKTFPYVVEDLAPVSRDVMDHFEGQDFEVTETNIPTGGTQVSIRKGGTFKAIPTAITLLIFWPVLIAQVWNMAHESKLDEEALDVAEESLKAHASKAPSETTAE